MSKLNIKFVNDDNLFYAWSHQAPLFILSDATFDGIIKKIRETYKIYNESKITTSNS